MVKPNEASTCPQAKSVTMLTLVSFCFSILLVSIFVGFLILSWSGAPSSKDLVGTWQMTDIFLGRIDKFTMTFGSSGEFERTARFSMPPADVRTAEISGKWRLSGNKLLLDLYTSDGKEKTEQNEIKIVTCEPGLLVLLRKDMDKKFTESWERVSDKEKGSGLNGTAE